MISANLGALYLIRYARVRQSVFGDGGTPPPRPVTRHQGRLAKLNKKLTKKLLVSFSQKSGEKSKGPRVSMPFPE